VAADLAAVALIVLDIGQVDRDAHEVLGLAAGRREGREHVGEAAHELLDDAAGDDLAVLVEGGLAAQVDDVPGDDAVGEADRLRELRGVDDAAGPDRMPLLTFGNGVLY
jgi:hypothetical protein